MVKRSAAILAVASLAGLAASAVAADVPGSADFPTIKRYAGSEIIGYRTRPYDEYMVSLQANFDRNEKIEGAATRIIYRVPSGHTGLEIERNYQDALRSDGFTQTFEYVQTDPYWVKTFLGPLTSQLGDPDFPYGICQSVRYFTAVSTATDKKLTAAVTVCETQNGGAWKKSDSAKPYVIKPGEILVWLDVITAKSADIDMVEVKAADMADALASKGKIDLYGIYFDTDRSDLKPDSDKTINEMATLLKIDRSLRLEIAGHTDSTGDAAHNLALSKARAAAVVGVLETKYGIAPSRLTAKGYGGTRPVASNDSEIGRAKNRRVELKKL